MAVKHVSGKKEYIYKKCENCIHADFAVAQGLHPDYGWWIQICKFEGDERCVPTYPNQQLSLF